uniref:Fn3_like domain-containing protein n=1 Tax=Rodentolepis nana TaxID=102285 RepID=A0A0R3TEU2_RODNA
LIAGCRATILLKNLNHFLPFSSKLKKLALIGPFAKSMDELIGSYPATPMPQFETPLDKGLLEVADTVHGIEFCDNGARCTRGDEAGLIKLLTNSTKGKFDAIVVTIGTGSKFVGESRDNPSLQLFGQQQRMLELISIYAPSIPVVVFIYSAAPVNISVVVASPQVRSILWFGYPGQEAGRIAARILLGNSGEMENSNDFGISPFSEEGYWWTPAGRLPFTWYESLSGMPEITNYNVSNHTYRFNQFTICPKNATSSDCQQVIYPFGYGLSYNYASKGSGFAYRNLDIPALTVSARIGFTFTVEVVNRGILAAEEVVQVYLDWLTLFGTKVENNFDGKYKAASRQLVGFERIPLFPGEVKMLRFVVKPEQLQVWSFVAKKVSPLCPANTPKGENCGASVPGSGGVRLSVGGQQPLQNQSVNSNTIIALLTVMGA